MNKETFVAQEDPTQRTNEARPFLTDPFKAEDCSGGCDACCSGSCGTSDSCQVGQLSPEEPQQPRK